MGTRTAFESVAEFYAAGITDAEELAARARVDVGTVRAWLWQSDAGDGAEFFARVAAIRTAQRHGQRAAATATDGYWRIRARLDFPPSRTLSMGRWLEMISPHAPPPDAEFPAPTQSSDVTVLLAKFGMPQQLLAAQVAVEWLLDRHGHSPDSLPPESPNDFAATLADARRLLAGHWQTGTLAAARRLVRDHLRAARVLAGECAAEALDAMAMFHADLNADQRRRAVLYHGQRAVLMAAEADEQPFAEPWAFSPTSHLVARFLAGWWDRVRCRLAVADAVAAALE